MRILLTSIALLSITGVAEARLPGFNLTCPGGHEVHADDGGPVYINGKETRLKKVNDDYFAATGDGITLSISVNPDGTPLVTYTGRHGANGVCGETGADADTPSHRGGPGAASTDTAAASTDTAAAERACLAAVARTTNVFRGALAVTEVSAAEAGIQVLIAVPGATAPWSCLADTDGGVQGVMFTGRDGD